MSERPLEEGDVRPTCHMLVKLPENRSQTTKCGLEIEGGMRITDISGDVDCEDCLAAPDPATD